MDTTESGKGTKLKVGLFTLAGLALIVGITIYVNDEPYWWRPCQFVKINVPDATGLKTKSPVRSLGLEIGYLKSVELSETHVTLGICVTAPVEILPSTRAYINAEGFLGDKVVELKPVRYLGGGAPATPAGIPLPAESPTEVPSESSLYPLWPRSLNLAQKVLEVIETPAFAADPSPVPPAKSHREIPVGESSQDIQHLVNRVDSLVKEMSGLTANIKEGIDPAELKNTIRELNQTLKNASRTLSPEGGLNQTAQRTLAKLEDAIEQLRDQLTRINKGEGSLGSLLNDPVYAEGIKEAIGNLNKLLSKVGKVTFVVDVGGEKVVGYEDSRAWGRMAIWPNPTRYYLLGVSFDPRGLRKSVTTTTTAGNQTTVVHYDTVETTSILLTAMLGKVFFNRLDLAVGALHGDGALRIGLLLGPTGLEANLKLTDEVYSHAGETGWNNRVDLQIQPYSIIYFRAGIDSIHRVNGDVSYSYGAGLTFTDDDIKLLFALR